MLDRSTVFIIGAGAGDGLDMPTGVALSASIAEAVNFYVDDGNVVQGQPRIFDSLKRLSQQGTFSLERLVTAGRMIAGGIRHSGSIDNYVNTHSDKAHVAAVAKIAIVDTILDAERGSALWVDSAKHPYRFQNHIAVQGSWLSNFFGVLQDGIIE